MNTSELQRIKTATFIRFSRTGVYQPKLRFVAIHNIVKRGAETWARARSHTFAKRIANALNSYTPNDKGV